MTDLIGAVTLTGYINLFSQSDNGMTIAGFLPTRLRLNELYEMFRKAPENAVVISIPGGVQRGDDLTADLRLTQYCLFDSDKLVDGWYLLFRWRFTPGEYTGHYPWRVDLFFIGTDATWKRGFELEDLDEEDSDWSI